VYVHGFGGPDLPTTSGAFQQTFQGYNDGGAYGPTNGWIVKFLPDGTGIVWMSYFGSGQLIRDMDIDDNEDLYVTTGYNPSWSPVIPHVQWPSWFTTSYRKTPYGLTDNAGGTADDGADASVAAGPDHSLYYWAHTNSTDCPVTSGAYQSTNHGGAHDAYVARFSSDGTSLIFGTYIGGSGEELTSTHNMTVDSSGNAYLSIYTASTDFPTTPGAYKTTHSASTGDSGIVKISSDGKSLLGSTFLGINGTANADGIRVDSNNNVYITGGTTAPNLAVTSDAYQATNGGGSDGFLVILKSDFSSLLYATYIGGSSDDSCRSSTIDANLNFICVGETSGSGYPTKNPYQSSFGGGTNDVIVSKFNYLK
jgi:hypothetical protein